jgi:hypothetical protein
MAKPDWGALQDQFLAEHASGISPKDWCEAQGLNYATAKRYIKVTNYGANSKSSAKKSEFAEGKDKASKNGKGERIPATLAALKFLHKRNLFAARATRHKSRLQPGNQHRKPRRLRSPDAAL